MSWKLPFFLSLQNFDANFILLIAVVMQIFPYSNNN